MTAVIACPLVTVARMTLAPPSRVSSAAGSCESLSIAWCAPSSRDSASLSFPRAIATVSKPIFAANWTPRWPRPPTPSTATRSPGRAPLFRRELKVVIPAQTSGAVSTADKASGIRASAAEGAIRKSE